MTNSWLWINLLKWTDYKMKKVQEKRNKTGLRITTLHILLPLLIGGLIYLFFHPTPTTLSRFFETQLEWTFLKNIRQHSDLPNFILHHVLDGLWAYALTATLIITLRKQFEVTRLAFISFMFCVIYEYAQYQDWVNGTFDWLDILVMGVFVFLAVKSLTKQPF